MSHLKLRGFIVREVNVGEADRIIDILCSDYGLISAFARGSRRTKSRLLASTQIFSLSDFELFSYKGKYSVDDAQLIETFRSLRNDIDRLVCASHLAEVLVDCMRDAVPDAETYKLWAYSMHALQEHPDPVLVAHAAQIRLLAASGFAPQMNCCVSCGAEIPGENSPELTFSIMAGGMLCAKRTCRKGNMSALSRAVYDCMRHCLNSPLGNLFNFQLSPGARREFIKIAADYLINQMEKNYTRLKMLDDLSVFSSGPKSREAGMTNHSSPLPEGDATQKETAADKSAGHSGHQSTE